MLPLSLQLKVFFNKVLILIATLLCKFLKSIKEIDISCIYIIIALIIRVTMLIILRL